MKLAFYRQRASWRVGGSGSPGLEPFSARWIEAGIAKIVLTPARQPRSMRLFRTAFRAMASEHELQLWSDDEATRGARGRGAAIADVRRIEAKYSRYRDDSVTTRINRAAGGAPVRDRRARPRRSCLRRPVPSR